MNMAINELDAAFDALKTFDWGADVNSLKPIHNAAIAVHGNAAAGKNLEARLAAALKPELSRAAKDYVCRRLTVMGTAESVPALAALLAEKDTSHMARYALERISAPEAAAALRDALPRLAGALKIGVLGSLGARRDAASVPALAALLTDRDPAIVAAAAIALGDIATPAAAVVLGNLSKTAADDVKPAVIDGSLVCAERLLAEGKKSDAIAIYKSFGGAAWPKHVRLAATRGLLAAAKKR
jgi:HEAT repeat protein